MSAIAALVFLCISSGARCQGKWNWTDGSGATRTQAELTKILDDHELWVESNHASGKQADLSNANLTGAFLEGANLAGANLDRAILTGADLSCSGLNTPKPTCADLSNTHLAGANLNLADLSGAHLEGANFERAYLEGADLTGASLDGTNFESAHLKNADLTGALSCTKKGACDAMEAIYLNTSDPSDARFHCTKNLSCMDLAGADLSGAQLSDPDNSKCPVLSGGTPDGTVLDGANLNSANLTGATMTCASLKGADLGNANLTDAQLDYAALDGAVFEPNTIPDLKTVALAKNLKYLTYISDSDSLAQLRKQFQDGAFSAQEKQITYAMNRIQTKSLEWHNPVQWIFRTVAFDLTCQYGMNSSRPLWIWLGTLVICALVNFVAIRFPSDSGIYKIQYRAGQPDGDETEEQIRSEPISAATGWQYVHRDLSALFWAGYFSLISAFNIGFAEINLGNWLQHLPRSEYRLKAKGWPRTVAGFQSLISLCLLTLWLVSYFGHPFE